MQDLDIIPILVVSDSQNKAEMLNGLLRGEGLAVHPQWVTSTAKWNQLKTPPELVFYFDDTKEPTLQEVVDAAHAVSAAVIEVSAQHDPVRAAEAIDLGATASLSLAETKLLAAIARRERKNRSERAQLNTLRHELEQNRLRLRNLLTGTQNAIAYAQEGVISAVNPAWAKRFGYAEPEELVGLPIMDMFSETDQGSLKSALRALSRGKGTDTSVECTALDANGDEFPLTLDLGLAEIEGERQIQFTAASENDDGKENSAALKQIDELETDNKRLAGKLKILQQCEPDSRLLWPSVFAPVAAERVNRPLSGAVRALVAFHPADPDKAFSTFGPLGMAEAGGSIATTLSPLLEDEDLMVRIGDLTVLAIVNRASEDKVQQWAETVLRALDEHIFETSTRSSLLGFSAGIAPIDRVRRLEQLTYQALNAASSSPGTVNRVAASSITSAADTDDAGWSAVINEALEERRFAIALRPIEDLSSASKMYEASARLLDREGKEILPEAFMEPASRLDMAQPLEQRLIGHAFVTLLRLLKAEESSQVIIPLSTAIMQDDGLENYLMALVNRTQARLPVKSLIFELGTEDALNHVADVETFVKTIHGLNCGFGLRNFAPGNNADKLLQRISTDSLRLSEACVARLSEDEVLAQRVKTLTDKLAETHCRVVASGVSDPTVMAQLYNIGICAFDGSVIGEAELFNAKDPSFEALYTEE